MSILPVALLGIALGYSHQRTAGELLLWLALVSAVVTVVHLLRREQAAVAQLALYDPTTGLPNRELFTRQLSEAIDARPAGDNEAERVAVLLIDMDRFREVNDALGHSHGDELLHQVAGRLRRTLRDSDLVARLGGDEFAVLLGSTSADEAAKVAGRILRSLEDPFVINGLSLDAAASIGIAFAPDHGDNPELLLQRADVALYGAKTTRGGFEIYTTERDNTSTSRLAMTGELRRAIENSELVLYYQPKAQLHNGHIKGVEALVRWQHPERGLVFPDDFIPLAEDTGLITPMTVLILDEAVRQCQQWRREGLRLTVSVNLSARSLHDPTFPEEVARLLRKWQLPPQYLELEITESAIIAEPARTLDVVTRLNKMGISLSLDDFGTGYSSLSYLKRLPVQEIKIDKSFVLNMENDHTDAMIVRSIIDLGRNLGLQVVAEGVENGEVWNQLSSLGCDIAQGYCLTRPIPPMEFSGWLDSYRTNLVAFLPDEGVALSDPDEFKAA